MADELAQLGYTPAELKELDRDCIRQQNEWLAIEETTRIARKRKEARDEQEECKGQDSEGRVWQMKGIGGAQEIGPEEHQTEARSHLTPSSPPTCTAGI